MNIVKITASKSYRIVKLKKMHLVSSAFFFALKNKLKDKQLAC